MKTIKDFTPEIQAKIPDYIKKGLNGVFDGKYYENFDIEKAKKAVYWNYEKCGFKKPLVLVAENPYEIFVIYKMLLMMNEKDEKKIKEQLKNISSSNLYLFTLNVYSNYYYYWYKFIKEEFKLSAENNPGVIVEYLKTSASQWLNGTEADDDVTFVVIKVK